MDYLSVYIVLAIILSFSSGLYYYYWYKGYYNQMQPTQTHPTVLPQTGNQQVIILMDRSSAQRTEAVERQNTNDNYVMHTEFVSWRYPDVNRGK